MRHETRGVGLVAPDAPQRSADDVRLKK